jgi:hypothetical protein
MGRSRLVLATLLLSVAPQLGWAQQLETRRDVNLRKGPSTSSVVISTVDSGTVVDLLLTRSGYDRVQTSGGAKGWIYGRFLLPVTAVGPAPSPAPPPVPSPAPPLPDSVVALTGPGTSGKNVSVGCGDGLWQHVYHPQRLTIRAQCVHITGTIVDATNGARADGVRHEGDGDTHGWLKLDPQFVSMLNAGNRSNEQGNLVFELVCHYPVTQADAIAFCRGFRDHTAIPAIGTHVTITGTFVQDMMHAKWNEIHPVSSIVATP